MTRVWVCVMVLCGVAAVHGIASDAVAQPGRSQSATKKKVVTKLLPGPTPRQQIVSVDLPTTYTINRDLGGWYEHPELNRSVGDFKGDIIRWTRFYDDVQLDLEPVTTRADHLYITRFIPELTGPKRPRRNKLIGEAKALKLAKVTPPTKATLFYVANQGLRRIRGTTSGNAMDFIYVVESWRLTYRVETQDGGVFLDAYTGEVVRRWSDFVE